MIYFSYNDYSDCKENGKIDEITNLEENKEKYKRQSGKIYEENNNIIRILNKKSQLIEFYKTFLEINNEEDLKNVIYCKNKYFKGIRNKNLIISKVKNKEIFVIINVINKKNNNIPYIMFEYSYNLIKKWYKSEETVNKRYPVVIPVVIYTGNKKWEINNKKINSKLNYTTFKNNKIIFSYNIIDILNTNFYNLQEESKSELIKEFIKIKIKERRKVK